MKKIVLLIFCFSVLISSCKKDDIIYDVNQVNATSYNANKNKLKTIPQYISILYANLFQKALSANWSVRRKHGQLKTA